MSTLTDTTRVSRRDMAAILGISEEHVSRLARDGHLPQSTKGRYDLAQAVQAYVHYCSHGKAHNENLKSKQRWEEAKAKKVELETAQLERKLVTIEDAQIAINEAMVIIATQLDGIGGRLASEIAGMTDPAEIRQRLLNETRRIRAAAADRLARLGAADHSSGDSEATTGKNSRPVGKSKSRATSRKRRTRTVSE